MKTKRIVEFDSAHEAAAWLAQYLMPNGSARNALRAWYGFAWTDASSLTGAGVASAALRKLAEELERLERPALALTVTQPAWTDQEVSRRAAELAEEQAGDAAS